MRSFANFFADILKAKGNGFGFHKHSHSAAVGSVVNSFVLVKSVITQLVTHDFKHTAFLCSADYASV